jgi:hypothetical protein
MSDSTRILAAMGAVPAGVQPKTVAEEGGEPGNYDISTLGRVIRVLNQQKLKVEAETQKKMETVKKKMDMYKTLRDSGYDAKSAYESVIKNEMKAPGDNEDFSSIKSPTERILNKMSKGIALSSGEQKVYDETIKHKQPAVKNQELLDESLKAKTDLTKAQAAKIKLNKTPNQQRMNEKILEKIANGTDLTPGEQKIYDEVIKKQAKSGSGDALSDILTPDNNEEKVKVQHPDGRVGTILKSKLPAALAAGFKKL